MQRRIFLQSLLGVVTVPLLADGNAAAGGPERAASPVNTATQTAPGTRRLLQESPLAGFQYHAGERLWPLLERGAPLTLRREPDNPYDERAVAVFHSGRKIGYIPRMENTAIGQLLERGERLGADIAALRKSTDPWERVRMAVYWEGLNS